MANYGNALAGGTTGALSGAATGATIGSFIPVIGTGIGATIGGILGGIGGSAPGLFEKNANNNPQAASGALRKRGGAGNAITGYDPSNIQLSNLSPEQEAVQNWLLQQGQQNANFQGIEDRANRQFNTQTVPSIAERFTAFGGPGTRYSSGFASSLGQAGSDLQSQLAALRGQYGMGQLQQGLQPRFENIYTPQQGGFAQATASEAPKYLELLGKLAMEYQRNKLGGGS